MTRRSASKVVGLAAVAATAFVSAGVLDSAPAGAATWHYVSGNIHNTATTPSIARFGNVYEIVWLTKTGSKDSLEARRITASGQPLGPVSTVQSGWSSLADDPTILGLTATKRMVAFGGYRHQIANDPYDSGAEYYATSIGGATWTLSSGSLSAADLTNGDNGTAVTRQSTTVISGFAEDYGVRYHVGASATNPAPGTDPLTQTTGPDSYFPGLGADSATGGVWALWYSNDGGGHHDGVWAQMIQPDTPSSLVHAPGSSAGNGTTAYGVQQDLSAASRVGGGVYTAYVTPADKSIDVWRVGAAKPAATIKDGHGPTNVVLVSSRQGRLWLFWRDFTGGWRATRSNEAATRFEPISKVDLPKGVVGGTKVAGDGSLGPLEAVGLVVTGTGADKIAAMRILPRLSASVSPTKVHRKHAFLVRVTDAGDPVNGATVHFNGTAKQTNKLGRVSFVVSKGVALGKHAVTAAMTGYTGAKTSIKVVA